MFSRRFKKINTDLGILSAFFAVSAGKLNKLKGFSCIHNDKKDLTSGLLPRHPFWLQKPIKGKIRLLTLRYEKRQV